MGKESGVNVLFKISNDGGTTYNSVAGQSDTQMSGAGNPVDVADKTTGGWGATIQGTRSVTVSLSGFATWPERVDVPTQPASQIVAISLMTASTAIQPIIPRVSGGRLSADGSTIAGRWTIYDSSAPRGFIDGSFELRRSETT